MLLLLVARPDGGVAVADVTGTSSRGDVMRLGWQYFRAEAIPQMEGVLDAVVQREARIGCPLGRPPATAIPSQPVSQDAGVAPCMRRGDACCWGH